VVGIGIGSVLGGTMLGNGKRHIIIMYNFIGLIASCASLYLNFYTLCIARFIHGVATGILVCAAPKMIEETVPAHVMDYGFGTSTNLCINVAIMGCLLLGIGLPDNDTDRQSSNYWMLFYGFAIPLFLMALYFNFTVFKYDSIGYHAKKEEKEQCLAMI
jgi:MFS family permease